jgi:hypothetical protein
MLRVVHEMSAGILVSYDARKESIHAANNSSATYSFIGEAAWQDWRA